MFLFQLLVILCIIGALASLALTLLPLVPGRASGDVPEKPAGDPVPSKKKTAAKGRCPKCGADQPSGNRFCGKCGSPLGEKN